MTPSRRNKAVGLAFCALTIGAIGFAIYLSLDPDNYYFYRSQDRADWVYEPGHVVFVSGLMLAEAVCAGVALFARRPRGLWLRCLLALIVLVPWTIQASSWVVHMPAYVLFHHAWAWLMVLGLILLGASSALRQVLLRLHSRSSTKRLERSGLGGR